MRSFKSTHYRVCDDYVLSMLTWVRTVVLIAIVVSIISMVYTLGLISLSILICFVLLFTIANFLWVISSPLFLNHLCYQHMDVIVSNELPYAKCLMDCTLCCYTTLGLCGIPFWGHYIYLQSTLCRWHHWKHQW